jgi:predicted ATP-dependent endonuclease of OLD family
MKISKIKIKNYRLLKDFELDLENDLSLVIGKNNCGKTSLLSILGKFLSRSNGDFSSNDFNTDFQKELKNIIKNNVVESVVSATDTVVASAEGEVLNSAPVSIPFLGISLKLFITYTEQDDLTNISRLMTDLDPANKTIVLAFEYAMNADAITEMRNDFQAFEYELKQSLQQNRTNPPEDVIEDTASPETNTQDVSVAGTGDEEGIATVLPAVDDDSDKVFYEFLKKEFKKYFKPIRKTIEFDIVTSMEKDDCFIDLDKQKEVISLDRIINFKIISARRDVSNKEPDKTLSGLSSKYYEKKQEKNTSEMLDFKKTLTETDQKLDVVYEGIFKEVVKKVKQFGGIKEGDSIVKIISTLQHKELLKGNATVMYDHNNEHSLPENYNGLGYLNLISMIFEIEILISDFRKENMENELPADINLLFIEEPEAHTHPQMQYVFIKNIKDILIKASAGEEGNVPFNLQTIITTHSSHITAESTFEDIKYFYKVNQANQVLAKNLKDLKREYNTDTKQYDFLKQYLTISRAELFFADKAILIEGDTERILLPTLMKKLDLENKDDDLPLLSQNISIVEVGAYSQIFEKFIEFLNIKALIITDLDAVGDDTKACRVAVGTNYSNSALKFFFGDVTLENLKSFTLTNKTFEKQKQDDIKKWVSNVSGKLCIVYQTNENNYNGRSFEDSFININREFVNNNKTNFVSIKNKEYFDDAGKDSYDLAEQCIIKKTHFALDILYLSDATFSNWSIPAYIKEGLLWLKKN